MALTDHRILIETLQKFNSAPSLSAAAKAELCKLKSESYNLFAKILNRSGGTIKEEQIEDALGGRQDKTYDIFLSYSHDYIGYSSMVYDALTSRGFSVFADFVYWGNIDDFLTQWLQDENSEDPYDGKEDVETYMTRITKKYQKMYSSLNVVLETMLSREIANSASLFLAQPPASSDTIPGDYSTFSPWVYHELFTAKLRQKLKESLNESNMYYSTPKKRILFSIDMKSFPEITAEQWARILALPAESNSRFYVTKILNEANHSTK
jgi:hypothetical protein